MIEVGSNCWFHSKLPRARLSRAPLKVPTERPQVQVKHGPEKPKSMRLLVAS